MHVSAGVLEVNLRISPCFCFLSNVILEVLQPSLGTILLNFQVKILDCFFDGKMNIRLRVAVWDGEWFSLFSRVPGLRRWMSLRPRDAGSRSSIFFPLSPLLSCSCVSSYLQMEVVCASDFFGVLGGSPTSLTALPSQVKHGRFRQDRRMATANFFWERGRTGRKL